MAAALSGPTAFSTLTAHEKHCPWTSHHDDLGFLLQTAKTDHTDQIEKHVHQLPDRVTRAN